MNGNGEQLIHLCAQNKLRLNNIFYPHKYTIENAYVDYRLYNKQKYTAPNGIWESFASMGTNHRLVLKIMKNSFYLEKE